MMHRRLLILFLLLILVIPATAAASFYPPSGSVLTYEQAADNARRFDAILDTLPDEAFARITTDDELDAWTAEIVPFFGYEAITGPDADATGYRYPTSLEFDFFDERGSRGQHHILGMANCMSGELWINARFANPASTWYESRTVLAVLVHELAHIQGICWSSISEQSAQLATLEVLAAMSVKGSHPAFASLIDELRDMSLAAAYGIALRDDRMAEYEALSRELSNDAFSIANTDKAMRYWAEDTAELERILRLYSVEPMQSVTAALHQGTCSFRNPTWNTDLKEIEYPRFTLDVPCVLDVQLPINQMVFTVPLVIDDLAYVWDHAEALAAALPADREG